MHKTVKAPISADKPQRYPTKASEIVARLASQKPWSSELSKGMRYMSAVSDALLDPSDWKAAFYAVFPKCGDEWAKACVMWYHGGEPLSSAVGVYSAGYACW